MMSDNNNGWESPGCETDVCEDRRDSATGFSERELLDIMYNTCDTSSSGEVLSSTIIQYLQTMTAESSGQDKLAALQQRLDPDGQDPHVSRETFHTTMREWISHCSQDSAEADINHASLQESCKELVNGLDFPCPQSKAGSSESHRCSCDGKDLFAVVAELKHAHHKLSEQNSSLLRTVAQCEDVNLQLTLEVTELRAKVASAQRSAVRVRSLTEELEETRCAFKEAQERAARSQTNCTKLNNELECLKNQVRRLEDKNEKLTFERTCFEETLNKLKKVNTELRAELQATTVMLTLRDREITKKDCLMDKMKNSHMENHNMIMDLQSEMTKLQEHSHQVILRYDQNRIGPQSIYGRDPLNHRSLQSEMQEMQQHHRALDDISLSSIQAHGDDIQSIVHRIKNTDIARLLQHKYLERDSVPGERQDRPFLYCQQQQASIKQQLVNVLQELELQKYVWEERAEKVEERWRASEKEHIQSQTGSQDAKKAAVLNWWKALTVAQVKKKVEETKSLQELSEAQEKLQRAERTISDMREQINHLQVSLRSALDCGTEQKNSSKICYIDKGTNTKREDVHKSVGTEVRGQKDAAVITEITGGIASQQEQTQLQLSADGLLSTLKRMEAMVTKALGTAELIRESEQRVIQVKTRMETITCQVQEALGRTSNTEEQLNVLEARITEEFTCQYPRSTPLADPRPEVKCFTEASDVDSVNGEKLESPPPSTVLPEVIESPQLPVNDCRGASSRSKLQEEETHILQDTPSQPTDDNPVCVGKPFIFPHTRSRPPLLPSMPTLPEEEEDSPEEMDSSSSSPTTSAPCENRAMMMAAPTIVYPQQATVVQPDEHPLEKARPHSPRTRLARSSSSGPITTVDSTGNVIDLVKDPIPEVQLSEEDRLKNLDLLEQAKRVSDRFLTRRGRRSSSSLTESPTGLSPPTTPSSSPNSSRSSSVTVAPQSGSSDATAASFKFVGQHLEVPSLKQQPAMTTDQEEHKLMRNQSMAGSKLADLSEASEQEKGPMLSPTSVSAEAKERSDAMPNISDVMLRKLKLHRGLPGCAPPLTEKEVENAFVQLSLAFRNDNYTLETRMKQAERERNLTEEDTEKELEEFKRAMKMTAPQWQNLEQREAYQRLVETVTVLKRLATRLSSRAEIVGAVRQEKRMNKATEVMMQYVENLKRTYEKDHAELTEFKKLANQNSNRCYGGSGETGEDGVPRSSRSMSVTLGKALPRRRVSVAVVPKFNLLNIPGQTPATAGSGPSTPSGPNMGPATGAAAALPVLGEVSDVKARAPTDGTQPAAESGKSALEQESEPAKPPVNLEEIRAEIRAELKAKIEEEAYNKGFQEGLQQSKVHQEEKHEEESLSEKLLELKNKDEESGRKMKTSRRMEEVLARFSRFCPKISLSRRLLWIVLTMFVVMCLVISIFSFFSDHYNRREDT